jgi:hypothetical protein
LPVFETRDEMANDPSMVCVEWQAVHLKARAPSDSEPCKRNRTKPLPVTLTRQSLLVTLTRPLARGPCDR